MKSRFIKENENITPSPTPPIKGGGFGEVIIKKGWFPSPLVGEGEGEGYFKNKIS